MAAFALALVFLAISIGLPWDFLIQGNITPLLEGASLGLWISSTVLLVAGGILLGISLWATPSRRPGWHANPVGAAGARAALPIPPPSGVMSASDQVARWAQMQADITAAQQQLESSRLFRVAIRADLVEAGAQAGASVQQITEGFDRIRTKCAQALEAEGASPAKADASSGFRNPDDLENKHIETFVAR